MEKNYDFRKRLDRVHRENIFDTDLIAEKDECVISNSWMIFQEGKLFKGCAALDLQDYLLVSMNISIPVYGRICRKDHVRVNFRRHGTNWKA